MNDEVRRQSQLRNKPDRAAAAVAHPNPPGIRVREVDWLIDLTSMLAMPVIWIGVWWLVRGDLISNVTLLVIIAFATPIITFLIMGVDWADLALQRIGSQNAQAPAHREIKITDLWDVADRPRRMPLPNDNTVPSHDTRGAPPTRSIR